MTPNSRGFGGQRNRARVAGTRREQTRVLILCGGLVTEIEYLNFVKSSLRASGIVIKLEGSARTPSQLASRAVELKRADARDAKSSKDKGNTYNSVWIVSDVDNFGADVRRAIEICDEDGILAAISNPCFELWLVLHAVDHRVHSTSKQVQDKAKALDVVRGKEIVRTSIQGQLSAATTRSKALREYQVACGRTHPHDNPTTNVDELVDDLVAGAKRALPNLVPGL